MANLNKPFGLSPAGYMNGARWNEAGHLYYIPSNDTNAYAPGDPVTLGGDADTNGIPSISIGLAGATCIGAIMAIGTNTRGGPYINPNDLTKIVAPATKASAYYALVADDPMTMFEIMEVFSGTAFTSAEVGLNANFVAGTNNGFISAYTLDNTTEATTSTLNCKILRLSQKLNNAYGIGAVWQVLLNNHAFRTGVTGA